MRFALQLSYSKVHFRVKVHSKYDSNGIAIIYQMITKQLWAVRYDIMSLMQFRVLLMNITV
jgi:hypothetical protein